MTSRAPARAPRRWFHALHLIWVVPVVAAVTWAGAFWIALSWCGISGCSGGGFGRISSPSVGSAIAGAVVIFLVWCAAIGGLPWTRHRLIRWIVAVVIAALVAVWVTALATSGFTR